jgi:hypothetical protein
LRPINPLTIEANTNVYDLPADFAEFGPVGSVMDTRYRQPLEEISPQRIQLLQRQLAQPTHRFFAVFQLSNGLFQLQLGSNSAAQDFVGWYIATVPELADVGEPTGTDEDRTDHLDYFPVAYHFQVLLNGLKAKISEANGVQDAPWRAAFEQGKARAIAIDGQGRRSTVQALPNAVNMW